MNLSYWEKKSWLSNIDFTIVGSGIVGLNCALHLKDKYPKAHILILEKGILPEGASTKNAGFACFGSLSEIIDDLKTNDEQNIVNLVRKRWNGLKLLRNTFGEGIGFENLGGYEIFRDDDNQLYETCLANREYVNKLLSPIFGKDIFTLKETEFNFKNVKEQSVFNSFESQIDIGKLMSALLFKVVSRGIKILNNTVVKEFVESGNGVEVKSNNFEFHTNKLIIATNGFANQLIDEEVKPARAQVLITKPIENLKIRGTFHVDRGFYYFRNVDNRILLGGGRNLDIQTEETNAFGLTQIIQSELDSILNKIILSDIPFEMEQRWSGIMGVGRQKQPIVKQLSNNVYCGVRLGGMGIAIGSSIGKELAELV